MFFNIASLVVEVYNIRAMSLDKLPVMEANTSAGGHAVNQHLQTWEHYY